MNKVQRIQALHIEMTELERGLKGILREPPEDPKLWSKDRARRYERLLKRYNEISAELMSLEEAG